MTGSDELVLAAGAVNPDVLASFAWIMGAALLSPLISFATGKRIPATVLLIAFGMIIGPNVLGLASLDGGVGLIREIGLGMLFLLAGFEINPKDLRGKQSRSAISTWLVCLLLCIGGAFVLLGSENRATAIVLAIALTSTAVGTLMPIMRQQDMLNNNVGKSLLIHGAIGEIAPILAMALLLSTRATWLTIAILLFFVLISITVALLPSVVSFIAPWLSRAMADGAGSNNQTVLRLVITILAILMAVAAVFELDVVLGAFAAGFILRQLVTPERSDTMEHLLDIVAFSLFIPVFFVCSGMGIDPDAVAKHPWMTVLLVPLIYVTRGLPIFLREQFMDTGSKLEDWRERLQLSLYAATALPIIVAVTEVALQSGFLEEEIASVLVAAGSLTVLLFPLLAYVIKSSEEVSNDESEDEESSATDSDAPSRPVPQAVHAPATQSTEKDSPHEEIHEDMARVFDKRSSDN
ncbi:cation:proton antiporter [Corynebacterium sp. 320]|nr:MULTISPECIES: cation:proton antiporter [Corynebacterium]KAB1501322.1 cation:proton antiporter [Corynebacterium sp. 320]KAB1551491.1 cation:proton antiporter [Corynebacterium sp. 321]KAB1551681.1 cation:proton antiporter [Corynebacterium sp. 319]KAB3525687.1 cation:proton antiporter [Corynebacterium sp. 250]KAB3538671.1 cation:proton antiporter [Corynebacterium sp. 366]